jgi:hypothetical protein
MGLPPLTAITRMLSVVRKSASGLLIQILSIATAVGLGIYGEGLWQARQDKMETDRLISAIATEMAKNRAKIHHFISTVDYWTSDEAMQAPLAHTESVVDGPPRFTLEGDTLKLVEPGKQALPEGFPVEYLLPDVAALLPEMLDYVPEHAIWTAAQYQREFASIKAGCLGHIQAINRSHDEVTRVAKNRLLPLFEKYARIDDKSPKERDELRLAIRSELPELSSVFNLPARAYINAVVKDYFVSLNDCDLTPGEFEWYLIIRKKARLAGIEGWDHMLSGEEDEKRWLSFALYPDKDLLQEEAGNFNPSADYNLRRAELIKKANELAMANDGKTVTLDKDGNITVED